ncbi:hypothetical protein H1C71_005197, partial [Ictidomys tridecemlineatus]
MWSKPPSVAPPISLLFSLAWIMESSIPVGALTYVISLSALSISPILHTPFASGQARVHKNSGLLLRLLLHSGVPLATFLPLNISSSSHMVNIPTWWQLLVSINFSEPHCLQ